MAVTLTTKLKLSLTQEQQESIRSLSLRYRDALNYVSQTAFAHNKTSSVKKLHNLTYYDVRAKFSLPSQLACQAVREVAAKYKGLWTKVKKNAEHRKLGITKKRFKGLDQAPHFSSRTYTLTYGRDYTLQAKSQATSLMAQDGRIKTSFTGYTKHLNWLQTGKLGEAKVWYDRSKKNYYLLVSVTLPTADLKPTDIKEIRGIDLNQRNISVSTTHQNKTRFQSGDSVVAQKLISLRKLRKKLQRKGTQGAHRKLVRLSLRERRLTTDVLHRATKELAQPGVLNGLEALTNVTERTGKKRKKGKKASKKQRAANRRHFSWPHAQYQSQLEYKSRLAGGLTVRVDADYTSQMCPACGHTSKQNRPNKGLLFVCQKCGHTLHADLIAGRNIALRTEVVWQDWATSGCLSISPPLLGDNVADAEAKAARLQRYAELRWSPAASPDYNALAFSRG